MKKDVQPKYYREAVVTCASCGATWKTGSTLGEIRTEVCSNCHPFFTGQLQRMLDVEGQVDRFYKRLQAREQFIEEKRQRVEEKVSPNRAVADLEIANRAKEALLKANVVTVGDVLNLLAQGEEAVLNIEGFGRKSLIDLKKILRMMGYDVPASAGETNA